MLTKIIKHLPGFNCGNCGFTQCEDFAKSLLAGKEQPANCPVLIRPRFSENKAFLEQLLDDKYDLKTEISISGIIDNYKADIILKPLKNEKSCRETLLPLSSAKLEIDDIVRYRPLGCPITHIAQVLEIEHSLITVVIIGPEITRRTTEVGIIDLGICMVLAFQGSYAGKRLKVGETIRFLPRHCMMQKVHSGVVVNLQNGHVRIEIIDLKVWGMPEKSKALNCKS
jgi:uncharacterized Fe-S cluster-containing protein